MTTLAPTTLLALRDRFEAVIRDTVPAAEPQRLAGWKITRDPKDAATTMRLARVILEAGDIQQGGYFSPGAVETTAVLAVRTDYAAAVADLTSIVQSDWHQIRERLALLTADPSVGLIKLDTTRTPPRAVAETSHGRGRIGESSLGTTHTTKVDLTYDLRYFRARAA